MKKDWRKIARSTIAHAVLNIYPQTPRGPVVEFRCGKTRPIQDTAPARASDFADRKLFKCWACDERKRLLHNQ